MFEFNLKTKLKVGAGEALNLAKNIQNLGFKKIALIIDSGVFDVPYVKEIIASVNEKAKIWEYNLGGEPDYESLDKIKIEFMDENQKPLVDCFVAIGGGSAIDFAKGLATLVVNSGPALNYRGFPENINIPLPVIALPTTAGTASEVTYNAVFISRKDKKKLGINTLHNFPILAILDPRLTLSCPKKVIISSGMDALTHSLESYVAVQANSLIRIFAKEAFGLVFNNLSRVLNDLENLEIRENLQLGAYLAGISLMNSGSGPAGAISYPLGVHFGAPHGLGNAIFLPHIIKHNFDRGYDYSELNSLIEEKNGKTFSERIFELCQNLGVPDSLNDLGVNLENVNMLLKDVEGFEKAFAQNPVPFTVEDGKKLIISLIK
jgi:alcohol dehydrogenase class IV